MKRALVLTLVLLLSLLPLLTAAPAESAPAAQYTAIWSDGFDDPGGLAPWNWTAGCHPDQHDGWVSETTCHRDYEVDSVYLDRNVEVSDGTLKLWVKKEPYSEGGLSWNYTGAMVSSYGKVLHEPNTLFQVAVVTAEPFRGHWYSIWSIPEHQWPAELDMAIYNDGTVNRVPTGIRSTYHWGCVWSDFGCQQWADDGANHERNISFGIPGGITRYHIVGWEWIYVPGVRECYRNYLDGVLQVESCEPGHVSALPHYLRFEAKAKRPRELDNGPKKIEIDAAWLFRIDNPSATAAQAETAVKRLTEATMTRRAPAPSSTRTPQPTVGSSPTRTPAPTAHPSPTSPPPTPRGAR